MNAEIRIDAESLRDRSLICKILKLDTNLEDCSGVVNDRIYISNIPDYKYGINIGKEALILLDKEFFMLFLKDLIAFCADDIELAIKLSEIIHEKRSK